MKTKNKIIKGITNFTKRLKNKYKSFLKKQKVLNFRVRTLPVIKAIVKHICIVKFWSVMIMLVLTQFNNGFKFTPLFYIQCMALYFIIQEIQNWVKEVIFK